MQNHIAIRGSSVFFVSFVAVVLACSTRSPHALAVPVNGASNLVAHYDASVIVTSGSSVTSWTNQGSGGAVLDAAPVVNSPTLLTGALNGQPVVSFGGGSSDEQLRTGLLGAALPQPLTVYHVGLADTVTNNPYWYDAATSSSRVAYLHRNSPGTNNPDQFAGIEVSGGVAPVGSFNIWSLVFDSPSNSEMRLNGDTFLATGNVGSNGFRSLTLASRFSNGQQLGGDIAELAVVVGVTNTAEQRIIENHLSSKYGIALTAGDQYVGDTGGNGNFDLDVFGIGRLDATNQQTSGALAGLGIDATGGTLGNAEWVLAGHKVTNNSVVSFGNDKFVGERWDRAWFVDTNNSDVDTLLTFDFSEGGLSGSFDASDDFSLLFAEEEGDSFEVLPFTPLIAGDQVSFSLTGADLVNGLYTLGINAVLIPEPSSFALLGLGLCGLMRRRRSRVILAS